MEFNLFNELNEVMNKDTKAYGSYSDFPMMTTGIVPFDYLNGQMMISDNGNKTYQLGVDAGKIITVIGKSGSGKSTFAIQMGYGLIKRYPQGSMFILDFEQANDYDRVRMVTGMSDFEVHNRVNIKRTGISTESVYRTIMAVHKIKMDHEKELMTENLDLNDGTMILPPTVVIIDSLAMMMPEDRLGEMELGGGMDATKVAKANTQLFKSIVQPCQQANIIPIFINHITQKISTSIVPTQAQTMFLSTDESLPKNFIKAL